MRIMLLMVVLLTLGMPGTGSAGTFARVSQVEGDVQIRFADSDAWEPVYLNMPVAEGDSVQAGSDGRFEVQLPGGAAARFDHQSRLNLLHLSERFQQLNLESGRIYLVTPREMKAEMQVDVDDTTVLPFSRSRVRIDALENGAEDVSIFSGAAYVESRGRRTRLRAGEQMLVDDGDTRVLGLNPPDEWERWNSMRSKTAASGGGAEEYLPEELRFSATELDSYGAWVDGGVYGMVWRPTVVLDASWAPYRAGRWVLRHQEYHWVGLEPWGWVPYHYGRWVMLAGRGWCWVPPRRGEVVWSGAYVAWLQTGSHIGWVPLAPGETTGSVSLAFGSAGVKLGMVFRNYAVPNGVTYISRNYWGTPRAVPLKNPGRIVEPVPVAAPPLVQRTVARPASRPASVAPFPPVPYQQRPQRQSAGTDPQPSDPARMTQPPGGGRPMQHPPGADQEQLRARFPRIAQPRHHAEQPAKPSPMPAVLRPDDAPRRQLQEKAVADTRAGNPVQQPAAAPARSPVPAIPETLPRPVQETRMPEQRMGRQPQHQEYSRKEQREKDQKESGEGNKNRKGWMLREKQ